MRVPLDPCYSDLPTTTYYYPAPATPAAPSAPPPASSGVTTRQRVPTEAEQPEKSVLKDSKKAEEKQPAEAPPKGAPETKAEKPAAEQPEAEAKRPAAEPKDSDPTGTPLLRLEDLKLSPAGSGGGEDTARPPAGKST